MSHPPTMMGTSRMRGRSVPPPPPTTTNPHPQQHPQQSHLRNVELPLARHQQPHQLTRSMSHMPLQQRPPPQPSTSPSMSHSYDPSRYYEPQSAHRQPMAAYAPAASQPTHYSMSHHEPSRHTHHTRAPVPHHPSYPPPPQWASSTAAIHHPAATEEDVYMEDVECKSTASISSIQQQRDLTSSTAAPVVVDPLNADGLLTPLNLADDVTPEEERLLLELQAKLRAIREENQRKAEQKKKEDQLLEEAKCRVVAIDQRSVIVDAIRPVYQDALEQHEWNEKRLAPTTPEELQRLTEQRQPEYLLKTKQEQVDKLKKIINSIEAPSREPKTVEGVITQPSVARQFLRAEVTKRIEQEEKKIAKLEKQIENKLKQRELNTTQEPPIKARLRHKLALLNDQREQLKQKQDELAYVRRIAQGWKVATGPNPPATLPQELIESKWWKEKVKLDEEAKEAPSKADQEKRTSGLTGELLKVQAEITQLQLASVRGPTTAVAPGQPPTESATATTPAGSATSATAVPTESGAPKPTKKRKKKHHDKKKNKQARQAEDEQQMTPSAEQLQQQQTQPPTQQPQLQPVMPTPQINYSNQGQGQIQGGMGWNGGGQQVMQASQMPQQQQQQLVGPPYVMVQPYPVMPVQYFQPSMQQPMTFQPQPLMQQQQQPLMMQQTQPQQQQQQPSMNQMMSQPPQQMTMQPLSQQQMQHQLPSQPLQPQPTPVMQQHPQPQAHQPPQLKLQSGQRVQYPSTVCVSSTNDFQTPRQPHPQTQQLGVGHMKSKSMSSAATGSRRVSTNQPAQYPHQHPQQQPFQG